MPMLSDSNISTIKFHCTQASHLVPSYRDSLTRGYSNNELGQIDKQIGRCEAAFALTSLTAGGLTPESQEVVDQNITFTTVRPNSTTTTTYGDRSKTISKRASYQQRLSAYYKEVETLARILGVELW